MNETQFRNLLAQAREEGITREQAHEAVLHVWGTHVVERAIAFLEERLPEYFFQLAHDGAPLKIKKAHLRRAAKELKVVIIEKEGEEYWHLKKPLKFKRMDEL